MSKLVTIELQNFMSLPYARFDFDQTGIISPVGYNDSGKSALRRALEILWFDKYTQTQVKMITDGQSEFTITNIFDDDVVIKRTKYSSGANAWLMTKAGQVIYTNQLSNGSFAATKGVPDAISQYLGVVKDDTTGEILNIRRNTNKLLPITTTGGENYQIFNNLCRGERIAYAVKALNTDVNAKNRELASNSSRLIGKQEALAGMQVFDEQVEINLLKTARDLDTKSSRLASLISITQRYNMFADKTVIKSIPDVDTRRLETLYAIKKAYQDGNKSVIKEIDEINLDKYTMLLNIKSALSEAQGTTIKPIDVIDTERYTALSKLAGILNTTRDMEKALDDLKIAYNKMRDELSETAKQNNWRICKNCGNIVTADDSCC